MKVGEDGTCLFCNAKNNLDHHHIVPKRYGGQDADHNYICVCKTCHSKLERVYDSAFFSEYEPIDVCECGECRRIGPFRVVDTSRLQIRECQRCGKPHLKEYIGDGDTEVIVGD